MKKAISLIVLMNILSPTFLNPLLLQSVHAIDLQDDIEIGDEGGGGSQVGILWGNGTMDDPYQLSEVVITTKKNQNPNDQNYLGNNVWYFKGGRYNAEHHGYTETSQYNEGYYSSGGTGSDRNKKSQLPYWQLRQEAELERIQTDIAFDAYSIEMPNNPFHGQQVTGSDGNVLTYDATIQAWLMPEVMVTQETKSELATTGVALPFLYLVRGMLVEVAATVAYSSLGYYLIFLSIPGDTSPTQYESKSHEGYKNVWPQSKYGNPPDVKKIKWEKYSDDELATQIADLYGDKVRGGKSAHNEAKKWFRNKREKSKGK